LSEPGTEVAIVEGNGELPQSSALSEAKPESLMEVLSRDPMGHSRLDRDRVVAELRERRKGWEAVENAGGHKRPKAGAGGAAVALPRKKAAVKLLGPPVKMDL
jgi:hypothetical protein